MQTEVVRSSRRKKTVQARVVDGVLRVYIPSYFDQATEDYWVQRMLDRTLRARSTEGVDLETRAQRLADRFGLPHPRSIVWSTRQNTMWGSCTPANRAIRISDRVASFPGWVTDYVIVHELAHLVEASH